MCGYGNPDFDDNAAAKARIYSVFEKADIGRIDTDNTENFRGHYSLDATNNYFTLNSLVKHETYLPYPHDEDPFGMLDLWQDFSKDKNPLVRVSDNDVLFYEKVNVLDEEGNRLVHQIFTT